jgi:hypothetical protein
MALAAVAAFCGIAVGLPVTMASLRTLRSQGPALVVDEEGIRTEKEFISWNEIGHVSSNEGDGNDLGIWYGTNDWEEEVSIPTRMGRALIGADKTIPLGGLVYKPKELQIALTTLHRQARKRKQQA